MVTVSGPARAYHTPSQPDAADAYAHALLYVLGADSAGSSRPQESPAAV